MLSGLVVGKFAPLHKGHVALIDFARARCDRLVILSYTKPEFEGCSPGRRAAWLEALFPDATPLVLDDNALAPFGRTLPDNAAPDEEHRAFVAWVCTAIIGHTVDRVFTSEAYGDGFAASLTRHFGHPVEHILFDQARQTVPVSATQLRQDPTLHRRFLPKPVRRDLVRRVALIGGESTGKTTLAAALAARLGTAWVPEYGRELWDVRGGDLCYDDLLAIAREQVAREDAAIADADGWLICDTSPLVTLFYCQAMFGRAEPELIDLAARRYDHVFLCAPDFPFVQDGTRRDDAFRREQNNWYRTRLCERGEPLHVLAGSLDQRLQAAERLITPALGVQAGS